MALFGALASPAAGATPQVLGHGATAPVSSPVVRTAANGDLLVLWSDGSRVRASFRLNGGRFFSPHVVPGLHSLDTRLAPAAGGLATWSSPPVQPYAHP